MNKAEEAAYAWLKKKCPQSTIVYQPTKTPDFLVDGVIAYEVKRGRKDRLGNLHIVGAQNQLLEIQQYKEAYILVVYDSSIKEVNAHAISIESHTYGSIIFHWSESWGRSISIGDRAYRSLLQARGFYIQNTGKNLGLNDVVELIMNEWKEMHSMNESG